MSSAISYEKIQIHCSIDLQQLLTFELHVTRNTHACIELKAIISEEMHPVIFANWLGEQIMVTLLDEAGATQTTPLFCGFISNVELGYDGGYGTISISALSASWMLDLQKKFRSFQTPGFTFAGLLEKTAADTDGAGFMVSAEDSAIEKPIIQYDETDWGFAMRMASHMHTSLLPDVTSFAPRVFVGLPGERMVGELISPDYAFGVDERYFNFGHVELGYTKKQMSYYDVVVYHEFQLGDAVVFKGTRFIICEKHAKLEKGLLLFTYRLATKEYLGSKVLYNPQIQGASLCGTVLATTEEHLQVHLDIDAAQPPGDAYWYSWKPETGNLMYDMPQVGTKVNLYIPMHDERSGICVECVRENGEVHPETADTNDRYLTTEHGMRMRMLPDDFTFLSFNSGNKFQMLDNFGNMFESSKVLNIKAKKDITFKGSRVILNAPKELTVVCRRWDMPSVINLCNNFDLIGKKSRFNTDIPPQPDTVQKMMTAENLQNASFSVAGMEQQILAAVPFNTGNDASINAATGMNVFFNTRQTQGSAIQSSIQREAGASEWLAK